jgi:CO dehydrogenase maturation factor
MEFSGTPINKGFTIAISGKGGVGKTGLCALLIRSLSKNGYVLAIDADPDSNLPHALGMSVKKSVGDIREAIMHAPSRSPEAAAKGQAFQTALHEAVEEGDNNIDLLVMGRPEGEGCYCPVNNILRQVIDSKANSYDFTVIDCEAGLEHLSRRTTRDVDLMIAVSDPTWNGLLTAKRVKDLAKELHVSFSDVMLVANKITDETKPGLERMVQENGLEITAYVPYDPEIALADALGKPIIELPEDSPASIAVAQLCEKIRERAAR